MPLPLRSEKLSRARVPRRLTVDLAAFSTWRGCLRRLTSELAPVSDLMECDCQIRPSEVS